MSFLLNLNICFSTFLLWKKIIHNTVYSFCIFTGGSRRNIFNYFPCMFFIDFPHNKSLICAVKSGGWGLEAVAGLRYVLRVEMQAYWFTQRTLAHWRQSTFKQTVKPLTWLYLSSATFCRMDYSPSITSFRPLINDVSFQLMVI